MNKSYPLFFNLLISLFLILTLSIFFVPTVKSQSDKVLVCHRTKGLQNHWVAISVSSNSLSSHLDHGDFDYNGDTDAEGNLLKDISTDWCLGHSPSVEPPSVSLFTITPQCQPNADVVLIRLENPTLDTINYRIGPDTSTMIISNFLPPSQDGQPSLIYHVLPTNQPLILDNYQYIFDENGSIIGETILSHTSLYFPSTSDPFCTFDTYCYNGNPYSLFDPSTGVVSYPLEGSTDGACIQ
ncbi:TPA: hypothetical protein DIC29_04215 [Candidatus Shapirobacteria bacterium]|nr:hypothetical protein [Candidatus Shapirobacteria bacterium]